MEHARVRVRLTAWVCQRCGARLSDGEGHKPDCQLLRFAYPFQLKGFFEDWDYRQEKVTGVPRHFLGSGHPIPVFGPLPKPKKDERK